MPDSVAIFVDKPSFLKCFQRNLYRCGQQCRITLWDWYTPSPYHVVCQLIDICITSQRDVFQQEVLELDNSIADLLEL